MSGQRLARGWAIARPVASTVAALLLVGVLGLVPATIGNLAPLPPRLDHAPGAPGRSRVLDRWGEPLALSYANGWNYDQVRALHEIPPLLRDAVVRAEDRRFFEHGGVDWRARGAAVAQNLRAGRVVRGASTISEQVIRMLHPRPRTVFSRWLEGVDARRLEARFGKAEILAFYLNQVPYARQRRGVSQAAHDLFGRDLETLSEAEMLALAVLIRSPSRLDPRGKDAAARAALRGAMARLADQLRRQGGDAARIAADVSDGPLILGTVGLVVEAPGFIRAVRARALGSGPLHTTLDAGLQREAARLADATLLRLEPLGATHIAALVLDHHSDEVLVWANASDGSAVDAVRVPRQPGSTLKPFVYGLALERGATTATLIEDAPMASPVGAGLHRYRNYSGRHYGPIRLRQALANSLNVPAVRVMETLEEGLMLRRLRALGFERLTEPASHYGAGLALGNGEVTLESLVRAYATLARGGVDRAPRLSKDEPRGEPRRHFDAEVASLLSDVLADDGSRALEFGRGGPLALPMPAAVKTGTSNDHRDAWAVGYTDRFVIGVWVGDLEGRPMRDVTGSTGPAPLLRALASRLHVRRPAGPLSSSPRLRSVSICAVSGARAGTSCPAIDELFRSANVPRHVCAQHAPRPAVRESAPPAEAPSLLQPTSGLHLAMDPRIPDDLEALDFELGRDPQGAVVEWWVDRVPRALVRSGPTRWRWPLAPGRHEVRAVIRRGAGAPAVHTERVAFHVRASDPSPSPSPSPRPERDW